MSLSSDNSSLGTPYRNFQHDEFYELTALPYYKRNKIDNLHDKIEFCGIELSEYVKLKKQKDGSNFIDLPVYCDNRSCTHPGCQKHRLYLYMKNHSGQIQSLKKSMRKPKAWVFTGWKIPYEEYDPSFTRKKLRFLYRLLSNEYYGSVSEFSVHMELKMYPHYCDIQLSDCKKCYHYKQGTCFQGKKCRSYGMVYLHFHVVTAGIKNLKIVRNLWDREIRYESAINFDDLAYYVSKYASKTPFFASGNDQDIYHLMTYKMQMHRFSCKKDQDILKIPPLLMPVSYFVREVKRALYSLDELIFKYYDPVNLHHKPPPPDDFIQYEPSQIELPPDILGNYSFSDMKPLTYQQLQDYLSYSYQ